MHGVVAATARLDSGDHVHFVLEPVTGTQNETKHTKQNKTTTTNKTTNKTARKTQKSKKTLIMCVLGNEEPNNVFSVEINWHFVK